MLKAVDAMAKIPTINIFTRYAARYWPSLVMVALKLRALSPFRMAAIGPP
jgi:hypothetical protein